MAVEAVGQSVLRINMEKENLTLTNYREFVLSNCIIQFDDQYLPYASSINI